MFSTQRDGRPYFHVSQYHILPGCLLCSDDEFPLETLNSREASQLCRSANHSCFSNQMLEAASGKLLPGAESPVVGCADSSSSALLPIPPDLRASPLCSLVPLHQAGCYYKSRQISLSLTVQSCG